MGNDGFGLAINLPDTGHSPDAIKTLLRRPKICVVTSMADREQIRCQVSESPRPADLKSGAISAIIGVVMIVGIIMG